MFQSVFLAHSVHSCDSSFSVHSGVYQIPHLHNFSCVTQRQTKQLRLFWLKIASMCHKNTSWYHTGQNDYLLHSEESNL